MLPFDAKNIAIFRALQLGDLLCAIPAIRALRAHYPHTKITLIGLPWAEKFVKRFPFYFNDFISFPGFPNLQEQRYEESAFLKFLENIRNKSFDIVLQMHGNGKVTNKIIDLFEVKNVYGFCTKENERKNFLIYPENTPEIKKLLKLVDFLGIPTKGESLEFPITTEEKKEAEEIIERYKLKTKKYLCINPSARDEKRRWSPIYFSKIADFIFESRLTPVFIGAKRDSEITNKITSSMHNNFINLTGITSLGALGVILKHSQGLLTNDTGVSHLADALEVPSVVIFTSSNPIQWAPLNKDLHKVVMPKTYTQIFPYIYELLGVKQQQIPYE